MKAPTFDNPYGLPVLDRGVYRDESSWPGLVEYRIVNGRGELIMKVELAADLDSEAMQRRLWAWLKKVDAGGHLQAI